MECDLPRDETSASGVRNHANHTLGGPLPQQDRDGAQHHVKTNTPTTQVWGWPLHNPGGGPNLPYPFMQPQASDVSALTSQALAHLQKASQLVESDPQGAHSLLTAAAASAAVAAAAAGLVGGPQQPGHQQPGAPQLPSSQSLNNTAYGHPDPKVPLAQLLAQQQRLNTAMYLANNNPPWMQHRPPLAGCNHQPHGGPPGSTGGHQPSAVFGVPTALSNPMMSMPPPVPMPWGMPSPSVPMSVAWPTPPMTMPLDANSRHVEGREGQAHGQGPLLGGSAPAACPIPWPPWQQQQHQQQHQRQQAAPTGHPAHDSILGATPDVRCPPGGGTVVVGGANHVVNGVRHGQINGRQGPRHRHSVGGAGDVPPLPPQQPNLQQQQQQQVGGAAGEEGAQGRGSVGQNLADGGGGGADRPTRRRNSLNGMSPQIPSAAAGPTGHGTSPAQTYRFVSQTGRGTWRAQVVMHTGEGKARNYYGGPRGTAEQAAHDADQLLFKLRGPGSSMDLGLAAHEVSRLAAMSLEDVLHEFQQGEASDHSHPPLCRSPFSPQGSAMDAASALMFMSRDPHGGEGMDPGDGMVEGSDEGGEDPGRDEAQGMEFDSDMGPGPDRETRSRNARTHLNNQHHGVHESDDENDDPGAEDEVENEAEGDHNNDGDDDGPDNMLCSDEGQDYSPRHPFGISPDMPPPHPFRHVGVTPRELRRKRSTKDTTPASQYTLPNGHKATGAQGHAGQVLGTPPGGPMEDGHHGHGVANGVSPNGVGVMVGDQAGRAASKLPPATLPASYQPPMQPPGVVGGQAELHAAPAASAPCPLPLHEYNMPQQHGRPQVKSEMGHAASHFPPGTVGIVGMTPPGVSMVGWPPHAHTHAHSHQHPMNTVSHQGMGMTNGMGIFSGMRSTAQDMRTAAAAVQPQAGASRIVSTDHRAVNGTGSGSSGGSGAGGGSGGGGSTPGGKAGGGGGGGADRPPFRYIVKIGSRWRAQVGQVEGGVQRKFYGPYLDDPASAACDADKILYKLRGAAAVTNLPLSPEVKAELDKITLSQLLSSFKQGSKG